MFVKKLVEKASLKKPGGLFDCLKSGDIQPRLAFHYGIPPGATLLAYDNALIILAISTRDGRIKLFGKDNTQVLLESPESRPSKFLQFIQNKGILLNVTSNNHIEVWDLDKKLLSHLHVLKDDITAFTVTQHTEYIYVGDSFGNVSVLKLNQDTFHIALMNYTIPFFASHGNSTEVSADVAVLHLLPHPTAESKRLLIVFEDGLIALWEIRESRTIFTTGGALSQSQNKETKKVSSACWACPFGSRLAVGYTHGEIFIWSIPAALNSSHDLAPDSDPQSGPPCKLNLGYRLERIPIATSKWRYVDGKASCLYVLGAPDLTSTNLLQVVLLNDHTESRTIKLGLHLAEPCIGMEIISSSSDWSKHKQDLLVLLGKSGHIYVYDNAMIEKYLLQSQSRGSPSLPKESVVKMPLVDSAIIISKFITNSPSVLNLGDEDYMLLAKNIPSLFPLDGKPRDGTHIFPAHFTGFRKIKNLCITGHSDGAVNFWDVSCPFFIPILSLKQQSEDDFTLSSVAVTALYFDLNSRLLISGDQSGMVRIIKFKPEPYSNENNILAFQGPGSSRKGNNHCIQSFKLVKVNGAVLSLNTSNTLGHLAVGSDQGFVSLIDIAGATVLYQKHIATELARGIISLQFETCSLHGFEKNVLLVATKDSSVLALDGDTGNMLSSNTVHPKKPSRALFLQVWDAKHMLAAGSNASNITDGSKGYSVEDGQKYSFLLLCSEKAAYVYSLDHVVQGVKKIHCKKKFQSSPCCWASTFCREYDVGLILLFSTGKIEIRSLPDLTLIRESSIRGFVYSARQLNSLSDSPISCSQDGELLMMNGDQEMFVVSLLHQTENFRNLDAIRQVCRKDLTPSEEELGYAPIVQKEKKKGLFGSVIKDMKGSKQKQVPEVEREDTRESIEEMSAIFSINNFPSNNETKESLARGDDGDDLGIDDIGLDDPREKAKDQNPLAAFSKEKLTSKFQAFKGKMIQMKAKNEKTINKEDEKAGAIDQIKKKYGFSQSSESNAAKLTESKLRDNVRMLQGINVKTTAMQDTARSFSSMAKEMLRTLEKDKQTL